MFTQNGRDRLDEWQYRIFRWVIFIIFLATAYELLDNHIHIGHLIAKILGR
jgi:hypothetical protein